MIGDKNMTLQQLSEVLSDRQFWQIDLHHVTKIWMQLKTS